MSVQDDPSSPLAGDIARLDAECQQAAQAIASARTVREAVEAAEVDVPHHLQAVARVEVPALQRLARARDLRVEEIVRDQLSMLALERNDFVASRDFDRLKAVDWTTLRANYPDVYARALREAKLILDRKSRR